MVMSSLLICEIVTEVKANEKILIDKIEEIYSKYVYYCDALDSFLLKGKNGLEQN